VSEQRATDQAGNTGDPSGFATAPDPQRQIVSHFSVPDPAAIRAAVERLITAAYNAGIWDEVVGTRLRNDHDHLSLGTARRDLYRLLGLGEEGAG